MEYCLTTVTDAQNSQQVQVFSDMISNIFQPIFEVSVNPNANIALHSFLKTVVGFDSVDDESKRETVSLNRCVRGVRHIKFIRCLAQDVAWEVRDNVMRELAWISLYTCP